MSPLSFFHPVSCQLGHDRTITIRSVEEALDFLDHRWPEMGEDLYRLARAACMKALIDPGETKGARYAFIDALGEAGLEPALPAFASPSAEGSWRVVSP